MNIMTNSIARALFVLTISLPFGSAHVHADERAGKGCEPGAFDRADHFLRHVFTHQGELGLTEEQTGKLREIHQALKKDQIKSEADARTLQVDLFPMLHDGKAELSAIEAKFKQMESLRIGALMSSVKATREAQAVLSPEQRGKIETLLRQERQRSGPRRDGSPQDGKEPT